MSKSKTTRTSNTINTDYARTNNTLRILGKNRFVSNNDLDSGFNNNDLIIGGSGCGKTGGYVIPNVRQSYGNMIVTDTKSQLYRTLGPELRSKGYEITVLDFVHPEKSAAYNPLDYIQVTRDKKGGEIYSQKDIVSLAHILIPSFFSSDAFWEDSARTVMTFLIAFTMEALRKPEHTMSAVNEIFKILLENPSALERWMLQNPDSFTVRKYDKFKGIMSVDKTWQCITQYVSEALEVYDFSEMDNIFGTQNANRLCLENLWERKQVIFLNISDTDRYADRLANLFYTQAMQQLCLKADECERGRLPIPVRFILDDFASNAYIEDFDKLISVIRSRNISVSVILQSLTQLTAMYSSSQANTIVTNCDHILYLGGQDVSTAQYIGSRCNKTEETVMLMPLGKAYLIERGKIGSMIDRVPPYANEEEPAPDRDAEFTPAPEELPF